MLLRSVLLLSAVACVPGQTSDNRFEALKNALGLTEMQIWQIRQERPAAATSDRHFPASASRRLYDPSAMPPRPYSVLLEESLKNPILDAAQQARLGEIVKVLGRRRAASEAIVAGLIGAGQWPGQTLCPSSIRVNAPEFGLADPQVKQLERLLEAAREPLEAQIAEKETARSELLLNSGFRTDSPAVVQATADISKLRQQWAETAPPRDLARAVLDDAQKAQLAVFETALDLVHEAIQLKLIPDPPKGEILCQ